MVFKKKKHNIPKLLSVVVFEDKWIVQWLFQWH